MKYIDVFNKKLVLLFLLLTILPLECFSQKKQSRQKLEKAAEVTIGIIGIVCIIAYLISKKEGTNGTGTPPPRNITQYPQFINMIYMLNILKQNAKEDFKYNLSFQRTGLTRCNPLGLSSSAGLGLNERVRKTQQRDLNQRQDILLLDFAQQQRISIFEAKNLVLRHLNQNDKQANIFKLCV